MRKNISLSEVIVSIDANARFQILMTIQSGNVEFCVRIFIDSDPSNLSGSFDVICYRKSRRIDVETNRKVTTSNLGKLRPQFMRAAIIDPTRILISAAVSSPRLINAKHSRELEIHVRMAGNMIT